jgi:hypothetical protein
VILPVQGVDYDYDPIQSALVFTAFLPPDGSEVFVTYRALP